MATECLILRNHVNVSGWGTCDPSRGWGAGPAQGPSQCYYCICMPWSDTWAFTPNTQGTRKISHDLKWNSNYQVLDSSYLNVISLLKRIYTGIFSDMTFSFIFLKTKLQICTIARGFLPEEVKKQTFVSQRVATCNNCDPGHANNCAVWLHSKHLPW